MLEPLPVYFCHPSLSLGHQWPSGVCHPQQHVRTRKTTLMWWDAFPSLPLVITSLLLSSLISFFF